VQRLREEKLRIIGVRQCFPDASPARLPQAPMADKPHDMHDPLDPAFAPDSAGAPPWPDSTRPAPLASTQFGADAFESVKSHASTAAPPPATFDVCHPALALRVVLVVQAAAGVAVLVTLGLGDWVRAQAGASFASLAASMLWLVLLCQGRSLFGLMRPALRAWGASALGAACALAGAAPMWWAGVVQPTAAHVVGVMLAGAALAAMAWGWMVQRARLWQPAQAAARLAELQSRIRPHFLFNALNTALALVRVDPDRAERVLEDLSALFREALAEPGASVSLDDEVELAQRYLAIEQLRFGDRLKVEWDIDPQVGRARVPPLVLQPLVENAVRHGVEPAREGGRLRVQAALRRGQAVVLVSNSVSGEPSRAGAGMALANVRERLRLLHDVGAQFDTWRDAGAFHARIVVPL
jgi:two-component system sensor histidine kinase AlgZ